MVLLIGATAAWSQGSGGVNVPAQQEKPYVILLSIDGFRWDFQSLFDTPGLDRISETGVKAEAMVPRSEAAPPNTTTRKVSTM